VRFYASERLFDLDDPRLAQLQQAISEQHGVRLRYHSYRSDEQLERKFLSQQPGFVRRELLRGPGNQWVALVYWASQEAAEAATQNVAASPLCHRYFSLMVGPDASEPGAGVLPMSQPNGRKGATDLTPEAFLATYPAAVAALAETLRQLVKASVPNVAEAVYPGWKLIGYRLLDRPGGRYSASSPRSPTRCAWASSTAWSSSPTACWRAAAPRCAMCACAARR
jgi:hypothetical protein